MQGIVEGEGEDRIGTTFRWQRVVLASLCAEVALRLGLVLFSLPDDLC